MDKLGHHPLVADVVDLSAVDEHRQIKAKGVEMNLCGQKMLA
jgi:hypothetical protein